MMSGYVNAGVKVMIETAFMSGILLYLVIVCFVSALWITIANRIGKILKIKDFIEWLISKSKNKQ